MKFGKALKKIRGSCNPEWFPYWLNYKLLKNKIKTLVKYSGTPITQDKKETDFFLLINQELKKTNLFYESEFKCLVIRYNRSKYAIKEFEQDSNRVMPDSWAKCMKACMQLYKDCVELESYVVMQYCGYSKILKKHDKNTGYATQSAFMKNVVNKCEFVNYHSLGVLMSYVIRKFELVQSYSGVAPAELVSGVNSAVSAADLAMSLPSEGEEGVIPDGFIEFLTSLNSQREMRLRQERTFSL